MIKEIIIVEGKTDIQFLQSFLIADFIETNGSEINIETLKLIKTAAEKRGVIILTDPDFNGERIRKIVTDYCEPILVKQAFINKKNSIKNGKVGVAESTKIEIETALKNIVTFNYSKINSLTYQQFLSLNLINSEEGSRNRLILSNHFHLGHCNGKTLFKRLNMLNIKYENIKDILK